MCVSPVSMFGGGGIDPFLAERYAVLNEQLRQKRIAKLRGTEPTKIYQPRVVTVETPTIPQEELHRMYSNPVLQQIPIHIAYRLLQRICDTPISPHNTPAPRGRTGRRF